MKLMWCWRCKEEMPMLDESEYEQIRLLFAKCMQMEDSLTVHHSINDRFSVVREAYKRITGRAKVHHNAIIHHRISDFGEPCTHCGKPLRTPRAKLCAACGTNKPGPALN